MQARAARSDEGGWSFGAASVCALLIVAPFLLRLSLLHTRTFDPDELQHLHAAWAFQQGLLPFRDFFEHHTPGIYYLLAAIMRPFDVAHSAEEALRVIFVARTAMWLCTGVALVLTIALGTALGGATVGWLSAAILSSSIVFTSRTLEIRPDVPALAFWTASQLAFVVALAPSQPSRRRWLAIGGLLLGVALTFTQKLLLAGPGFAAFALLYIASSPRRQAAIDRTLDIATIPAAALLPIAAAAVPFAIHGALHDLLQGVFWNNLGWPQEVTVGATLDWMLLRDPMMSATAVGGMVFACGLVWRTPDRLRRGIVLLPAASLLAALGIMPTPYPQYLLLVMPILCVCAAEFLLASVDPVEYRAGTAQIVLLLSVAACAAVAVLGLAVARPYFRNVMVYPLLGCAALALAVTFARAGRATAAAVVLVAAFYSYTAQQLVWMHGLSNADAIAQMKYVHSSSGSSQTVMDGFSGFGWFRPQASYYWFVAPGVRPRLTTAEVDGIVATLEGCEKRPAVVILDRDLKALSPRLAAVVSGHYDRTPFPLLWVGRGGRGCGEDRRANLSSSGGPVQ